MSKLINSSLYFPINNAKEKKENTFGNDSISDFPNPLKKIVKLLQDDNLLELSKQWEKIFTLFVINNDEESFIYIYNRLVRLISEIECFDLNKELISKIEYVRKNKVDFIEFLNSLISLPLALNIDFFNTIKIKSEIYHQEKTINAYRKSNLFNNNYVTFSLINYSNLHLIDSINYFNFDTSKEELKEIKIDDRLLKLSPRFIHLDECFLFGLNSFINKIETDEFEIEALKIYKKANNEQ